MTGLKVGHFVEITTEDGSYKGIVKILTDELIIVSLAMPMTSPRSHSYHWRAGELKSELFKRITKIKNITEDSKEAK